MNRNTTLKVTLLCLLLANLVIQSVEAYSFVCPPEPRFIKPTLAISIPTPPKSRDIVTSNVIMAWHIPETDTIGHHNLDGESFEKLREIAHSISSEDFQTLISKVQAMPNEELLALLSTPNFKEQFEERVMIAKKDSFN